MNFHPGSGLKTPSPSSTSLVIVTELPHSSLTICRSAAASPAKSFTSVKSALPNGLGGYFSNPETAVSRSALWGLSTATAAPTPSMKTCDPSLLTSLDSNCARCNASTSPSVRPSVTPPPSLFIAVGSPSVMKTTRSAFLLPFASSTFWNAASQFVQPFGL